MNSRDFILQKIRNAMVPVPVESVGELPPLQESENPSVETMGKTFSDALEAMDESALNDAELAYYIEVTSRVSQKLLKAAG